jgi:DNA repair exonuclease SbcCD ATPase subunit
VLAAEEQSAQRALETATAQANHLEVQSKELQSALQKQSACQPTVAKLQLDLAAAETTINEQLGQIAQQQATLQDAAGHSQLRGVEVVERMERLHCQELQDENKRLLTDLQHMGALMVDLRREHAALQVGCLAQIPTCPTHISQITQIGCASGNCGLSKASHTHSKHFIILDQGSRHVSSSPGRQRM